MKVAVIGAGIIGTTTALRLAEDGHQVTVFDAQAEVAEGASRANAGVIAPGYVTPWSAPGMPGKVLRQLPSRRAAVRWHPRWDADQWRWLWRWWRATAPQAYQPHRAAMLSLAAASLAKLRDWRARYAFSYGQASGYLQLLRSEAELHGIAGALTLLRELGVAHALVDAAQCHQIEPGLNRRTALHAGVHLPQDEVGDCRAFALQARRAAEGLGARFALRHRICEVVITGSGIKLNVEVSDNLHEHTPLFDAAVICAGSDSAALLRPLGLRLPLLPVWGYSLTAPLREPAKAPRAGIMDERYKTAITRLGDQVRVAGTAEIGARAGQMHPAALQTLRDVLHDWFPEAADLARQQGWMGARPMLPEGPPLIGPTAWPGLYLNLGHGSSGWALACGSAELLADQLAGRPPRLAPAPYLVARYRG